MAGMIDEFNKVTGGICSLIGIDRVSLFYDYHVHSDDSVGTEIRDR